MSKYRLIRSLAPAPAGVEPRRLVAIIHPDAVAAIASAPAREGSSFVYLTTGATLEIHVDPETLARDLGIAPPNAAPPGDER